MAVAGDEDTDMEDKESENEIVGRCMLCSTPHDEYHSPYDRGALAQTRCSYCRVLCLVCPSCKSDPERVQDIASLKCEMCQEQGRGVATGEDG